ncbi:hypothetical protein J437_LFUL017667 [Ladona fulva]|uniref:Uncharacterized protein n=1 Tax=Ladona fulva TaxID=123851 RepID=A0A8K0KRV5_LADFU|nr:hypothetical protein J437_LFUL017667 [Ladona fulva]
MFLNRKPKEEDEGPVITAFEEIEIKKVLGEDEEAPACKRVAFGVARALLLAFLLYFFICSLDLMASAFRHCAPRDHRLEQSSGGSDGRHPHHCTRPEFIHFHLHHRLHDCSWTDQKTVLDVRSGIPLVMGANVGTSVTSTIVSFSHAGQREDFGRAFAGATVHDCFNWLSVIVILPLEVATGYLFYTTEAIVNSMPLSKNVSSLGGVKVLQTLTDPFTQQIVILNKTVINEWSKNNPEYENATLLKTWCGKGKSPGELTECIYLAKYMESIGDTAIGAILLLFSLILLFVCMGVMVKILQKVLKGTMANAIRRAINAEIPKLPWLGGYISILVGCVATFLLQSSSVVTSLLTPLVGLGLVSLERAYPLTMGSNLGTTGTAIIASLASPSAPPLQLALTHTLFNATGILLFYPIPIMRWPIPMAYSLGRTVARRRWVAILYILTAFIILPTVIFTLSRVDNSNISLYCVLGIVIVIVCFAVIINKLQSSHPNVLPPFLRTWDWLPHWMHSWGWADKAVSSITFFFSRHTSKCFKKTKTEELSTIHIAESENSDLKKSDSFYNPNMGKKCCDNVHSPKTSKNNNTFSMVGSDNPTFVTSF